MNSAIRFSSCSQHWAMGEDAAVLTKIYDERINIALWQRELGGDVQRYVDQLLQHNKLISIKLAASPTKLMKEIQRIFPATISLQGAADLNAAAFYEDVYLVLDMFACLFDATEIGLRINTLERAMCPRFHKDNVAVRLVTTYAGPATEWLSSAQVSSATNNSTVSDRSIHFDPVDKQSTTAGTIALLKGERWEGNEGRGIVHRSPEVQAPQRRLLLTCDLL